jgi:hypothetical protein
MRILKKTPSLVAAAANGVVGATVSTAGFRQACMEVHGTFVGEVTVEASACGTVWFEVFMRNAGDSNHAYAKKVTAPTLLMMENLCGVQCLRAKVTSYSSGEIFASIAGIG